MQLEKSCYVECTYTICAFQTGSLPDRFPYHHYGELIVDATVSMLKNLCVNRHGRIFLCNIYCVNRRYFDSHRRSICMFTIKFT